MRTGGGRRSTGDGQLLPVEGDVLGSGEGGPERGSQKDKVGDG